jgi:membrane associated rhomboid family serine protease
LIGANVLVFLHEITLSNSQLDQFLNLYAVIPRHLTHDLAGTWTTLFTSQFLHGGWLHLISNMLYLWVFGKNIEDRLGHFKYLIFYLSCGALAALCQCYFMGINSGIPSLGASGAIAGILGAYILWFPQARIKSLLFLGFFMTLINIPALYLIGLFFIENLLSGFASLRTTANMATQTGGVAYWAHIGGFVSGMILAPLLNSLNRDG